MAKETWYMAKETWCMAKETYCAAMQIDTRQCIMVGCRCRSSELLAQGDPSMVLPQLCRLLYARDARARAAAEQGERASACAGWRVYGAWHLLLVIPRYLT
jgi:hypothetical protein